MAQSPTAGLRLPAAERESVSPAGAPGGRHPGPSDRSVSIWQRLYVDARCLGLSGEAFWRLRLRELWLELEAGRRRDRRSYERAVIQAYLVEYMARQKELSAASVEHVLRGSHKQTPAEQRAAIATIQARYGLKSYFVPKAA